MPGTVALARVPFANGSGAKRRPVVLVGNPSYWAADHSALVCPVTTAPPRIADVPVNWQAAGLLRRSCVRPRPIVLSKGELGWRVGALAAEDLEALEDALRTVLGL